MRFTVEGSRQRATFTLQSKDAQTELAEILIKAGMCISRDSDGLHFTITVEGEDAASIFDNLETFGQFAVGNTRQ